MHFENGRICWREGHRAPQVGACIVGSDQIILGIGYNGFPRGVDDKTLPWAKMSRDGSKLQTKYPYVVHAEANAILNAKNTPTLAGAVSPWAHQCTCEHVLY